MGFSAGNYAKIKEVVETKENYTVCKVSISRKNRQTNSYEMQFFGFVKFVGDAHKQRPMADQRIKITSCDVCNCYVKNDSVQFLKNPQNTVFSYELQDGGSAYNPYAEENTKSQNWQEVVEETDLPF